MSDGPHKSLPLRFHWRKFAERAATDAYSIEEVSEALPFAIREDLREAPLATVWNILAGGEQQSLFCDEKLEKLEVLRKTCRGSSMAHTLIDCAIEAVGNGLTGGTAYRSTLENAFDGYTYSICRSVEEHYLRKASNHEARFIRNRLSDARRGCDFKGLAEDLMAAGSPLLRSNRLPRRTGIDEGPRL